MWNWHLYFITSTQIWGLICKKVPFKKLQMLSGNSMGFVFSKCPIISLCTGQSILLRSNTTNYANRMDSTGMKIEKHCSIRQVSKFLTRAAHLQARCHIMKCWFCHYSALWHLFITMWPQEGKKSFKDGAAITPLWGKDQYSCPQWDTQCPIQSLLMHAVVHCNHNKGEVQIIPLAPR